MSKKKITIAKNIITKLKNTAFTGLEEDANDELDKQIDELTYTEYVNLYMKGLERAILSGEFTEEEIDLLLEHMKTIIG